MTPFALNVKLVTTVRMVPKLPVVPTGGLTLARHHARLHQLDTSTTIPKSLKVPSAAKAITRTVPTHVSYVLKGTIVQRPQVRTGVDLTITVLKEPHPFRYLAQPGTTAPTTKCALMASTSAPIK